MGKDWDKFKKINSGRNRKENEITAISRGPENYIAGTPFQQWTTQWAKEALRIAKPGATMLVFGGTRTWHRLACGLEDAGWVIKDTLMWLTGQGFPKATDISKQIDKKFRAERKIIGKDKRWKNLDIRNGHSREYGSALFAKVKTERYYKDITIPTTPEAKLWNGWKSHGLKPAYEPIIMCQKKNDGTYANNALKWGVAGLNIDAGRIPLQQGEDISVERDGHKLDTRNQGWGFKAVSRDSKGRFPANILLDEEVAKMLDEQSGISKSTGGRIGKKDTSNIDFGLSGKYMKGDPGFGDIGGASRFFYVAKASKRERTANGTVINNHPTVKSLRLMEYLVKLTSMPSKDQVYLDPFLGSGTTAMACKALGKDWIGIEKEEEYVKIAKARIKAVQKPLI